MAVCSAIAASAARLSPAVVVALVCLSGCNGTAPSAKVSDPAVFTLLHLRAVQLSDDPNRPASFTENMQRYFAQKPAEYEGDRRRMDAMLDSQQRLSGFFQAIQTSTSADIAVALKNLPAPKKDEGTKGGGAKDPSSGGDKPQPKPGDGTPAPGGDKPAGGEPPADKPGEKPGDTPVDKPANGSGATGGGTGSSGGTTQAPTPLDEYRKSLADTLKTLLDKQVEGSVSDSPFDQLDRVADFYAAYILKLTRHRGDSRVEPPDALVKFLQGPIPDPVTGKPTTQPVDPRFPHTQQELQDLIKTGPGTSRMLVLYFQSHVDPGSSPNRMTGVRVQVIGTTTRNDVEQAGDTWQTARADEHGREVQVKVAGASLVKVLRLHPTRNYDVESVAFGESLKQALALTGKITAPLKAADINASGARNAGLDAEERRRFLSRIGKAASFADATNHEFGWNYYPSNLQVVRPGAFEYIFQWLFGTPRAYKVQAYMEGGARDSVAVLLVPRNLHSIRCRVWTFSQSLNPNNGSGSKRLSARDARELEIILPKWNDYEIAAAALGVFTKTSSTQMVK